jgi:predicted dithiol-disulfide oxidoreductase (DUF899 family)
MWAEGYNGIHHHIATRAAFVVSSPEPPEVQRKFAASRGWKFPMISHAGSTFAADMGFRTSNGWQPGIFVFQRTGQKIVRVSEASLPRVHRSHGSVLRRHNVGWRNRGSGPEVSASHTWQGMPRQVGHCREPAILHAVPERRFPAQLKCGVLTCAVPRSRLATNH